MQKYKMTGCARFFIFLIFFVPALYFGVSYYNGEDGLQNIKDILNIETKDGMKESNNLTKDFSELKEDLTGKNKLIDDLNEQIENLQEQNRLKDIEIKDLKEQLSK